MSNDVTPRNQERRDITPRTGISASQLSRLIGLLGKLVLIYVHAAEEFQRARVSFPRPGVGPRIK